MSTSSFQLVFNGYLNDGISVVSIAPAFSEILDIPLEIAGTYFTGRKVVLVDNCTFKAARDTQTKLEMIGVHCDIKPVEKIDSESSQQFSAEAIRVLISSHSYRSSFSNKGEDKITRKDDDQFNKITRKNTETKTTSTADPREFMIDASELYEAGYKDSVPEKKSNKEVEIAASFEWKD